MFSGYRGYAIKPTGYCDWHPADSKRSASKYGTLNLKVEFLAGQNLPLPPGEKHDEDYKPYVKCELHVEQEHETSAQAEAKKRDKQHKRVTRTARGGKNPDFGLQTISWENVSGVMEELSFVR